MNKTIIVEVERLVTHPMYKKRVRKTTRFAVHSEVAVKNGDVVEIVESKPFSKTKRHIVKTVLTQEGKGKK
jgi:small subunit ribosomal protein S17